LVIILVLVLGEVPEWESRATVAWLGGQPEGVLLVGEFWSLIMKMLSILSFLESKVIAKMPGERMA
jgi:hypothetical protein